MGCFGKQFSSCLYMRFASVLRHCEERSDEVIQQNAEISRFLDCFAGAKRLYVDDATTSLIATLISNLLFNIDSS